MLIVPLVVFGDDKYTASLYGKGINPIFGDTKARDIDDILMVYVNESYSIKSSASKKIEKKSNINYNTPKLGKDYEDEELKKDYSATNSTIVKSNGKGNTSKKDTILAVIMAKIVQKLNNNIYKIEGSKELDIDGEKTVLKISGMVRAIDIGASNTIQSKYIFNQKLSLSTSGEISKATHNNKGTKTINNNYQF